MVNLDRGPISSASLCDRRTADADQGGFSHQGSRRRASELVAATAGGSLQLAEGTPLSQRGRARSCQPRAEWHQCAQYP